MKIKKISPKIYKYVYGKVPRLCVDLVIKNRQGILLTKRQIKPWQGQWHFAGGTVRYGESLKEAAARVAADELGIKVKIKKVLGPYEFFKSDLGPLHAVSIGLLVEAGGGRMKPNWQASELRFFKKLPKNIIPEQRQFLLKHKIFKSA